MTDEFLDQTGSVSRVFVNLTIPSSLTARRTFIDLTGRRALGSDAFLSRNLQFRKEYTLYRMWSTRIHSTDTDFLLGISEKGHPIFRGIRDPSKLKDYGSLTSTMLLNSIRTMAEGYCPKVDIRSWYVNRVRSLQIGLLQIEIVVSTDAPLKKE